MEEQKRKEGGKKDGGKMEERMMEEIWNNFWFLNLHVNGTKWDLFETKRAQSILLCYLQETDILHITLQFGPQESKDLLDSYI